MTATIIAVANYKGGVGKTESVYRIGLQWAMRGQCPLLIDLDPQANLTRRCGAAVYSGYHVGAVLGGAAPSTATLTQAAQKIDLGDWLAWIVASDIQLENVAVGLLQRNFNRLTALANAIAEAGNIGGPILIDTPPNAGVLTLNALVAASHVVVCADPEEDAIAGVRRIQEIVGEIDRERGVAPRILGTIATRVDTILTRHAEGLAALKAAGMPPLLGSIPKRAGQDADRWLNEAYADVAERIWREVGHA
ncbi:MAG: ParA family protein [Caldilineaceae bacterium]|nr:ParA family protein [Caldilineaceae bacterium]